eukprot:2360285-Pyramimonas_sp.AAC.1
MLYSTPLDTTLPSTLLYSALLYPTLLYHIQPYSTLHNPTLLYYTSEFDDCWTIVGTTLELPEGANGIAEEAMRIQRKPFG